MTEKSPEGVSSDPYILYLLSVLHKRIQRSLDAEIKRHIDSRLSISHGDILYYLLLKKEATIAELTKHLSVTKSTMTVLVRKLESLRLVDKVACPNDKRQSWLKLTPLAISWLSEAKPLGAKVREHLLEGLDQAERQQLAFLLGKLKQNSDDWS